MRIAIIGYGKMGQEIERQAHNAQDITATQKIRSHDELLRTTLSPDEIAIVFTSPESVLQNIEMLLKKNVPIVCGTTGWYDHIDLVQEWVKVHHGTFLHASNFSIGVHLFWKALDQVTQTLAHLTPEIEIQETHHSQKKDRPSGTALTCQARIQKALKTNQTFPIRSIREGEVLGDHRIKFETSTDAFELHHHAKSRAGFAQGALTCAQWLRGKKGFFSIEDYLLDIQSE